MARRRELADVANGITGHAVRPPWLWRRDGWSLWDIPPAVRRGLGQEYSFDILTGSAEPSTKKLDHLARSLAADLIRHLSSRGIDKTWVASASLTITLDSADKRQDHPTFRIQVLITDDLGRNHTSTRRSTFDWTFSRTHRFLDRFTPRFG
jgi:hypothetical protein